MEENLSFHAEDIFCDDEATLVAQKKFNIHYLYPWQRLVIGNILDSFYYATQEKNESNKEELPDCNGKQIVLLPTGAGKSLCFQIPSELLPKATLVIYPLLALMTDQARRMEEGGLKAVTFRGGQSEEEREELFEQIKNGSKIIIANPEVLSNKNLLEKLKNLGISHLAIDEAHCVSEWGDSFRPAYLELGNIIEYLSPPVVTAFTATASPEVLERISDVLFKGEAHVVRSESDRQNIHYYVKKVASKKQAVLMLSKTEERPMIIFCGTRGKTEDMACELNTAFGNETARFYHAGLSREEKTQIEKWFFNKKDAVLCATCAYGMGVDKKDIHTVIHLDPPETAESYIQEAGRGGRDGSVANAILLWNQEDRKKFAQYKKGTRKAALKEFAESTTCRRQILLDALGAELAVCSGCDICDSKENPEATKTMPSSKVPEDVKIAEKIIKFSKNFFLREEFEEFFLSVMNKKYRKIFGLNTWNHDNFCEVYNELLSKKTIRVQKWPWKGRLCINNQKKSFRRSRFFRRLCWCLRCSRRFLFLSYRRLFFIICNKTTKIHK